MNGRRAWIGFVFLLLLGPAVRAEGPFRIAPFSADVTIPLDHRCMGVLPTKSKSVADPLEAIGFVLLGGDKPFVFLALDWCEIRNGAYDQWRTALAVAAGTDQEHVLVCSLHQHDAPVTDNDAAKILDEVNLQDELQHREFHDACVRKVAAALNASLPRAGIVTHFGTGDARVEGVASNRRVVHDNGGVSFGRGSSGGGNPFFRDAPDGEIDPFLKTLSFWNGETPIVALNVYATHPMSYYGRGEVSADFVGLARRVRQRELPGVLQIYASGCSGDVTAGKYNDGSPESRERLIERMAAGMRKSWEATKRQPLTKVAFRSTPLRLEFSPKPDLAEAELLKVIRDESARTEDRILAAMGLASRRRVESDRPIDVPCLDLGTAQLVLLPGEAFVGYQLMAQSLRPDAFVVTVGYGECWPGYIPTLAAEADGFADKWYWVAPHAEHLMRSALKSSLTPAP